MKNIMVVMMVALCASAVYAGECPCEKACLTHRPEMARHHQHGMKCHKHKHFRFGHKHHFHHHEGQGRPMPR